MTTTKIKKIKKIEKVILETQRGVEVFVKWTDGYGIDIKNGKLSYYKITSSGQRENMKRSLFVKCVSVRYVDLMESSQSTKSQ